MRLRTVAVTSLVAVAAAGTLTPALAAPKDKKPITKTYEVGPLLPDPTPILGDVCTPTIEQARHAEPFKVPAAGRLKVDIEFVGDWALGLRDAKKGSQIAFSDGSTPETPESMDVKFKRATDVFIDACNFAGAPTATVTYTFTFS
jgi:hypothetical protein